MGFIRSVYVRRRPESPLDIIPVDLVANALIASAWQTATGRYNRHSLSLGSLINGEKANVGYTCFCCFKCSHNVVVKYVLSLTEARLHDLSY